MAWSFATGAEVPTEEYEAMYQATAEARRDTAERQDIEFNYAMRTILQALVSVHRPQPEPAETAAHNLIDTATYAGSDAGKAEEIAWLDEALHIARKTDDAAIDESLFAGVGQLPPAWLLKWEQR